MKMTDAQTLWQLFRGMSSDGNYAQRLDTFYRSQAADYDRFRERLLPGRLELMEWLKPCSGERIVEMGAGTGRNPEYIRQLVPSLEKLTLVDLCPSLLKQARERWSQSANVFVVEADATTWRQDGPVDAVFFSYSLTMIPDWRSAMDNAVAMLRPGGRLAVVDFTISQQQSWLARFFWRKWFSHDGVHLNAEHLIKLRHILPRHEFREYLTAVPYLPGLSVPYYLFCGIKK